MQQADAKLMPIHLKGIERFSDVSKIRVIFKQNKSQDADIIKEATWSADGTGNATYADGVLTVSWSIEDTYLFKPDQYFYTGFQIMLAGSVEMPSVKPLELYMSESLFSEEEAGGND